MYEIGKANKNDKADKASRAGRKDKASRPYKADKIVRSGKRTGRNRSDADTPHIRVHGRVPFQKQSVADVWLLRKWDQVTIAICITLSLIVFSVCFIDRSLIHKTIGNIDKVPSQSVQYQIDVNQAKWEDFASLPGIGEEKARTIVMHRESVGAFHTVSDLASVKGIGPKILTEIRPFVYVCAEDGAQNDTVK